MTAIQCIFIGETGKVQLICESCHQLLDLVTVEEVTDMSRRGYEVYCFDCDAGAADEIPPALAGEVPYKLRIDNREYVIDWPSSRAEAEDSTSFDWGASQKKIRTLWRGWKEYEEKIAKNDVTPR